jgi:hypothetical protein
MRLLLGGHRRQLVFHQPHFIFPLFINDSALAILFPLGAKVRIHPFHRVERAIHATRR